VRRLRQLLKDEGVDFFDVTTNSDLGSATLSGGKASLTTSALAVGNHAIVASYSGDSTFLPSLDKLTQAVRYNFGGFLAPLNQNVSFGLNRTIPIKFQLTDFNGTFISSLSAINSLQASSPSGTTSLTASLSYDPSANQFVANWKTKGLLAGTYTISLTLADGTVKTVTLQLSANGKGGSTQMAAGSDGGDNSGLADTLLAGDLNVYISDPNGYFSSAELARIQDTINGLDTLLAPYGVTITEVTNTTSANLVLDTATTSACGGAADGVLGCFNGPAGEITILQGWSWYAGADPTLIGASQYDFQSTVTHEFGHALGLGGATDASSPMYETLAMGQVHRTMTVPDLNLIEPPQGPDPERAAPSAWATVNFLDIDHVDQHSNAESLTTGQDWNPDRQAAPVGRISNPSYWEAITGFANAGSHLLLKGSSDGLVRHSRLENAHDPDQFWSSIAADLLMDNRPAGTGDA